MSIWNRLFGKKTFPASPLSRPSSAASAEGAHSRSDSSHPLTSDLSKKTSARDRVVRVFVSSTFKDMVEDRNELMAQVWPALRKVCRGRSVEFVEVDLRWGVTEEQSQRKETLRHCLAEIRRCRPYFIGLLGERYGWTPGQEAFSQALLDEEGWLKGEIAKHSVTELEILHGVLNDPEMAGRAFFYFRDPRYAVSKGGDYLSEDAVRPTRQDALKQKVRTVCEAKSIPLRENYADPRALAALVLADLTAAIDAEFPADQVPDLWSREDRDHEAYARSRRTEFYVGRDAYFDRLDTFARDGADGRGLTVLGASGGGKSALLANWVERRRQAHPGDFVFQHYIGSSAMSAGHLALMRRLMVAIVRWCGADDPAGARGLEEEEKKIPAQSEEIVKVFPDYLYRLAFQTKQRNVNAVLVLDALNQIEDRERGRLLAWLPARLPGKLRLIVSTLPGDTFDALQPRGWPALTVEPLTAPERVQLIARYLRHFAQGLSEARARKIAAAPAASNPLYIKTLLDDLRATGDHQQLDNQIADYLRAADIPALLGKILARFERDYEHDRPGLVRDALSLLWAARRGLTEPELLQALGSTPQSKNQNHKSQITNHKSNPAPLPAALWSPVRCSLEDGLVDRDGILAFAHEHLRTAVERRYMPDQDSQDDFRLLLAGEFERQPVSARNSDELPWLLWQTESFIRLRSCLLDIDRFLFMQEHDANELINYWVGLKEERTIGRHYVDAFQHWATDKDESSTIAVAANRLANFLCFRAALHAEAEPLMRLALEIFETNLGHEHPHVATQLNNLALLLQQTGRLSEAEPLLRRALRIDEQTFWENPLAVAIDLSNVAGLLQDTNRLTEAEPLMRRALEINEQNYGENHPSVAACLNNLAQLLKQTNRIAEAEPIMRRTLTIFETSLGGEHPDIVGPINNLAQLLQTTNRFAEAEPLMYRALKICEKSLGNEHPNTSTQLNNLAHLLLVTSRFAEAEPLMRRALRIDEQNYGDSHPSVARDLNNLAQLLKQTNRLTEVEPLMRRSLKISESIYGQNHPNVARDLNNLAGLLLDTNRLAEAEPLLRRALAINERSYGEYHTTVAYCLNNLAQLLHDTNRFAEAEPLMCRALTIDEQNYGENHPNVAISLNNLAQLLQDTNRVAEAEPLMRRALTIDERSYGEYHPNVAIRLSNLAQLLKQTNRIAEAEPLMRRALMIDEKSYGGNHPSVAVDLCNLAGLLKVTNRFTEAEPLMRRALTIFENSLGNDHPNVAAQLNNLAQLLQSTNRFAEAEPPMRRMVEILLNFTRSTGHPHPRLQLALDNYSGLLHAMGKTQEEIRFTLTELTGRYGVEI